MVVEIARYLVLRHLNPADDWEDSGCVFSYRVVSLEMLKKQEINLSPGEIVLQPKTAALFS